MKFLPFLILFMACSPQAMKATEDAVEGEIKVAEQVMKDLACDEDPRPIVEVEFVIAKF